MNALNATTAETVAAESEPATQETLNVELFGKQFGEQVVLGDISLSLPAGSFTVITGPSGCGKTTLIKIIAGLDQQFSGFTANRPLNTGIAFQEPRLIPWRTVRDNIKLVCQSGDEVDRLLAEMGLLDAADRFPGQISLGMARRAALARAFAVKPNLLLLDEPLVSLDEGNAERIRQQLLALWLQHGPTVMMVTHDLREALQLADRILILGGTPTRIQAQREYPQPQYDRDSAWIEQQLETLKIEVDACDSHQALHQCNREAQIEKA